MQLELDPNELSSISIESPGVNSSSAVPEPRISDSQLPGSNFPGPSGSFSISMSPSKDFPSGTLSSLPRSSATTTAPHSGSSVKTASSSSPSAELTDTHGLASNTRSSPAASASSTSSGTRSQSHDTTMSTDDSHSTPTANPGGDPPKGQPSDEGSSSSPTSASSSSGHFLSSTSRGHDSDIKNDSTTNAPTPTQGSPSHPVTVTSTTKVRGTSIISTMTSTTTMSPESTFSSIVSVPVTDPKDGHVSASTPAFVTEIYTSTESNGSSVMVTHIIANPTEAFHNGTAKQSSGLLQNQGATAGVFTAVGFVVAGTLFGVFWFCRRRRRRAQQKLWMHTLAVNQEDDHANPFSDPPEMRHATDAVHPAGLAAASPQWASFDQGGYNRQYRRDSGVPFADYPVNAPPGLALTTDQPFDPTVSRAPSSPSIYPASLPPDNGRDVDSVYEVEMSSGHDHRDLSAPDSPIGAYVQPPPPVASPAEQVRRKVPPLYMPSPPASASGSQESPRLSPEPVTAKIQDSPVLFTQRSLNHRPGSS